MTEKKLVLELNNIDLLGRRFNGYDLLGFFAAHPNPAFKLKMLVNNRKPYSSKTKNLFASSYIEEYDWIAQATERKILGTKNQISLAEDSLIRNPLYQKADILHFHLYHNMNLPIEFLTRIDPHKKIIIDIHDTYWLTDSHLPMLEVFSYTNQNAKSLNAERRRVLESIDAEFVVHSPYILDLFKKSTTTKNLKNVTLINFGIDTDIFHPYQPSKRDAIRASLGIPQNNVVLFCRAQSNFKGVEYIKKALKSLNVNTPITILTCVELGMFQEFADKYQVLDMGVIYDDHQMANLFNACDIFLSPSTEESFGFMAAEAMACGKPVIVFNGTALPDTTNAPAIGYAVDKSPVALRDAITHLITDKHDRKSRGQAGVKYVTTRYRLSDYFANYAALFHKLSVTDTRHPAFKARPVSPAEVQKFQALLPRLQHEFDHPTASSAPTEYPIIDYNDPGVQKLIQDFNTNNYRRLTKIPLKNRFKYTLKRLIPTPIITSSQTFISHTSKHTPAPIKKFIKKLIRRN